MININTHMYIHIYIFIDACLYCVLSLPDYMHKIHVVMWMQNTQQQFPGFPLRMSTQILVGIMIQELQLAVSGPRWDSNWRTGNRNFSLLEVEHPNEYKKFYHWWGNRCCWSSDELGSFRQQWGVTSSEISLVVASTRGWILRIQMKSVWDSYPWDLHGGSIGIYWNRCAVASMRPWGVPH